MECDFCCRGCAQNLDITRKIIDTTLDKVKNFEIRTVRVTGGEPFLNKDGFLYLIGEIIRRNVKIIDFLVFTNGTIIDSEMKEALVRIGKHCKKVSGSDYGKRLKEWGNSMFIDTYDTHSFARVIVSTIRHKPIEMGRFLGFYKNRQDESILCSYNQDEAFVSQKESIKNKIALEGNGAVNYRKFIAEGKYYFGFVNNKFCLIDDMNTSTDGYINIIKTITISSNGNVFAGCSQSYEKLDKENICNILTCNDLFKSIDRYSWKYPLLEEQNNRLNSWLVARWCYEHGIKIAQYLPYWDTHKMNDDERMYGLLGSTIDGMYDLEESVRYVHRKYPYFSHFQAAMMALYSKALQWYDEADGRNQKTFYLEMFGGFENQEEFQNITREEIEKVCKDLLDVYKQHILDNDPLCRFLYRIGVV